MKKTNCISKITAILIVAAMLFAMSGASVLAADDGGKLTVNGSGGISVKPDIAILTIGVVTKGKDTSIQKENSKDMDKIIAAIKKAGISEKDIKTASYYLSPEYDYTYDRAGNMDTKIKGYIVYNRISVTVKNIDKAGDILVVAEEAGANEIGGVAFTVSNPEKFYEQALEKAIADGKKKAGVMAKAAGVTLGKLLEINEGYNYNSYRYTEYAYSGGAMAMAAGDYGGKVGLETGEIVITAEVTLVYGY